jgi:hypothetical protein
LKLDAVGLNKIQYRLILRLQLLETVCHWSLLSLDTPFCGLGDIGLFN